MLLSLSLLHEVGLKAPLSRPIVIPFVQLDRVRGMIYGINNFRWNLVSHYSIFPEPRPGFGCSENQCPVMRCNPRCCYDGCRSYCQPRGEATTPSFGNYYDYSPSYGDYYDNDGDSWRVRYNGADVTFPRQHQVATLISSVIFGAILRLGV